MWNFTARFKSLVLLPCIISAMLVASVSTILADPRIYLATDEVVAEPNESGYLDILMDNYSDDIAALSIHVIIGPGDIASFSGEFDGVNYQVDFDTVGTLVSGWPHVEVTAIYSGDQWLDAVITALGTAPFYDDAIAPQSGGVLLRLRFDVKDVPHEQLYRIAYVYFDNNSPNYLQFSTPLGELIGWTTEPVEEVHYYMCVAYEPEDLCLAWERVPYWQCPAEGCDSIAVVYVDAPEFDDQAVILGGGAVTANNWTCGDVTGDGNVSIGDVSRLIDHLFIYQPPIDNMLAANTNCSDEDPIKPTIGDISTLIDHLFINQEPLCCAP